MQRAYHAFHLLSLGDGFGFRRPCGFRLILPRTPAVPAGNFSDLPRAQPQSYALGVKRPSPTEILGLTIFIVIVAAALFGLMYYMR